ncbi:hypothetical protein NW762_005366 [Fusarium torreyae]|uniref:Oxidoreductase n=1 Tax=Fusarium torreyae TaxID=1237075 RepID=A0A9W8VFS6_9HYPO|nr:hypothetical protein NW762_005366 [Fusarium torreyae]
MTAQKSGLVVIGAGGMGPAISQRLGSANRIFLADYSERVLDATARSLRESGYDVETHIIDVCHYDSVRRFAQHAAANSRLMTVINTAGISHAMGNARRVYEINLVGNANVLDAFVELLPPGSSFTTTASIAGHIRDFPQNLQKHLAEAPRDQLLQHEGLEIDGDSGYAYEVAKRGVILRVQAVLGQERGKGVRINVVSPGITATPMIETELASPEGDGIRQMINMTPVGTRAGTTHEIANAFAFLAGPESSFVNGADIVVDGGCLAVVRARRLAAM